MAHEPSRRPPVAGRGRSPTSRLCFDCNWCCSNLPRKPGSPGSCSEPLRHDLDGAESVTTTEAKTLELMRLCDADDLPPDANREAVRAVAKRHSMGVAQALVQD